MTDPVLSSEVQVVVLEPFASALKRDPIWEGTLHDGLTMGIETLLADLTIPTHPEVSLEVSEGVGVADGQPPFKIFVEGQEATRAHVARLPVVVSPVELVDLSVRFVYTRRDLFISPSLVDALAAQWTEEDWAGDSTFLSPHQMRDLLSRLVRRCVSLKDGRDYARIVHSGPPGPPEDMASRILELALSESSSVELDVALSTDYAAALFDKGSAADYAAMLQEHLFEETGVVTADPRLHEDRDLPGNTMRVQVNDLRHPVRLCPGRGQLWVRATPEELADPGRSFQAVFRGLDTAAGQIVDENDSPAERARFGEIESHTSEGWLGWTFAAYTHPEAGSFVTSSLLDEELTVIQSTFPALAAASRERFGPLDLAPTMRRLVDMGIPIRDLRGILEELVTAGDSIEVEATEQLVAPRTSRVSSVPAGRVPVRLTPDDLAAHVSRFYRRFSA